MGEPHPTYEELKQQLAAAEKLISSFKAGAAGTGRPGSGAVEGEPDAALGESRLPLEADNLYLADLIQKVSDAIFSCDTQFRILSWNKAAENIYGWRAEEVLGKNIKDITGPDTTYDSDEHFVETLKKNSSLTGVGVQHRKNGELFYAMATITALKDKDGNDIGAVTIIKDISDRVKVEKALKEREAFLTSVIDNTPSPLWVSDANGTVIRMNQALRDLLQITDEEVIGKYNVLEDAQVAEQGYLQQVKKVFQEGKPPTLPSNTKPTWKPSLI
jgi:PAS domain S-box-containing protein